MSAYDRLVAGQYEIELSSGAFLDLANPQPVMTLQDVAMGLSKTCRFAGQCSRFYSVAEHSIVVSRRLRDLGESTFIQLAGLHHDDAEAFLGDITRPLKALMPDYRALEERMLDAVLKALDMEFLLPSSGEVSVVKEADDWALAQEANALMPSKGLAWGVAPLIDPYPNAVDWPRVGGWSSVMGDWLRLHHELVAAEDDMAKERGW